MATTGAERWRVLSPYLDRALEMGAEERAIWLSALRDQEPDVARDLEALLREHRDLVDERFLDRLNVAAFPGEPPAAGQVVGAYTLVSPIGYGGMGTVWLARRSDGRFERQAAVKFLNVGLAGRGEARFRREGRILARLTHPHIAQLLDAGIASGGQGYLVLEHVDGHPIDAYCDGRALGIDARIRLMLDVLAAVAHAHANLIVHRDIKPSNVLVSTDGEVKLLDFGIARLLEDDAGTAPATLLTQEGFGPFTPEFAAPEQLKGEFITTATDVYALGVLLYLLLTGQHPAGKFVASPASLVRAITEVDPLRPSDVVSRKALPASTRVANAARRGTTPDRLRQTLGGDLDRIVGKALRKQPRDRYTSPAAFADDLQRYLAHRPVAARPHTLAYRAGKFVRRNRPAVALAALALVAIAAGAAGTMLQERSVRAERDFALHALARAEAVNDLDAFLLSDAAPSGKPFTVNDLLARADRIVERQHGGDGANAVSQLVSIGRQYYSQDDDASSRRVLSEAYTRSRALADASIRARASCALAATVAATGELPRAERLFLDGLRKLPTDARFTLDRAFCLMRGSEVARDAGAARTAVDRARAADALVEGLPVRSDIERLHAQMNLAESYRAAGQLREANVAFAQASALLTSLGRDDTQTAGTMLNNWALVQQWQGRPREAEQLFRRALAISSAGSAEESVSPMLLVNEARALRDLGRLREAIDYAERGRAGGLKAGDDVVVNQALLLLAGLYRRAGDLDRSARALSEVEPRMRHDLPPGHFALAAITIQHATLAQARGDLAGALAAADEAIRTVEASVKSGGQGRDAVPDLLLTRSGVEREMGRGREAAADAARALALLEADAQPGRRSSTLGSAYLALGRALLAEHEDDRAVAALRTALTHLQDAVGADHPDTRLAQQLIDTAAAAR